jgi:hypothetical protein
MTRTIRAGGGRNLPYACAFKKAAAYIYLEWAEVLYMEGLSADVGKDRNA